MAIDAALCLAQHLVLISSSLMRYGWRMARPVVKLSVNLPPGDVAVLRELAKRRRTTMTDVIRKGIGTEKILVEDRRGRRREIVLRDS